MVLRREDDVLHAGRLGDGHPLVGVELHGVEALVEVVVLLHRRLASARPADLLARKRHGTPVDEHAEAQVAPPLHSLGSRRNRALHERREVARTAHSPCLDREVLREFHALRKRRRQRKGDFYSQSIHVSRTPCRNVNRSIKYSCIHIMLARILINVCDNITDICGMERHSSGPRVSEPTTTSGVRGGLRRPWPDPPASNAWDSGRAGPCARARRRPSRSRPGPS